MQDIHIKCTSVFEKTYHNPAPVIVHVGGVRSGKSYGISQSVNLDCIEFAGLRVAIGRKVAATLKPTLLKTFIDAATAMQLWEEDNFNKTDRYYEYDFHDGNPIKSTIQFFGLDNSQKVMGSEYNLIWIDEATEFSYEDYLKLKTRLSAKKPIGWNQNKIILSLNPNDARGWIRTKLLNQPEICLIESTYKDNPFLDADYIRGLEAMKDASPQMYKMLVLNQWGVSEGRVFDKWELYDETTAPKDFEQVIYGLDFGFNHPTALIECSFKDNAVYLREVIYKRFITNPELIDLMDKLEVRKDLTMIADSAEPARIADIFNRGYFRCEGIKKIDVVKTIDILKKYKIYIHKDSKNLQSEFDEYEWKKNLAGQYLDKLEPDKQHDDAIAAVRYATQYFDQNTGAAFYV